MQKMLQIVSEGLNRAVRVALRWGGLERLTIYCAMLLHVSVAKGLPRG